MPRWKIGNPDDYAAGKTGYGLAGATDCSGRPRRVPIDTPPPRTYTLGSMQMSRGLPVRAMSMRMAVDARVPWTVVPPSLAFVALADLWEQTARWWLASGSCWVGAEVLINLRR